MISAFNVTNPQSVIWARDFSSQLIVEISTETRRAIQTLIAEMAFEDQLSPRRTARAIRPRIGLTKFQGKSVDRFYDRLRESGVGIAEARRQRGIYSNLVRDRRAMNIARTETMAAANEGQRQLWIQQVENGNLTGAEMREWIVTPDNRLCPICAPMAGQLAGLKESFTTGNGGLVVGPPAHPQCRCATALVSSTTTGTGTPAAAPPSSPLGRDRRTVQDPGLRGIFDQQIERTVIRGPKGGGNKVMSFETEELTPAWRGLADDILADMETFIPNDQARKFGQEINIWMDSSSRAESITLQRQANSLFTRAGEKPFDIWNGAGTYISGGPTLESSLVNEMAANQYARVQAMLRKQYPNGKITVYRGVKGEQGRTIRLAAEGGKPVVLDTSALSSWTIDEGTAAGFATSDGVVIKQTIDIEDVFSMPSMQTLWRAGDAGQTGIDIANAMWSNQTWEKEMIVYGDRHVAEEILSGGFRTPTKIVPKGSGGGG